MNDAPAPVETQGGEMRYAPAAGHWDEAVLPSGFPRRHWRKLSVALGRMGLDELSRSWQNGQHLIEANGISYNISSDPDDEQRSWRMDPIPLVISEREWVGIETAVIQRARLLNAMLHDLYGAQRLVHEGRIPPELLFANPHFLRPCHGFAPVGGVYLHSYAADLARSPNGDWWVLADRTQVPSGTGYVLENRLVSARTLPNIFSQHRVRPLAPFIDAKRDALLALAASQSENPRVVILTSGPHSETYFEHSFLAGHWGFPLVEGADLTVRDNRVYLKTLAGLEPVDLIVRRVDDDFCDPLELRGDSLLGVPGLLQAARSGSVIIDNALGSGLAETPGHVAFLPGLCRELLDENLSMPSVATWWCGQAGPRRYVLEHLDQLTILPAFPRFGLKPEFPALMSAAAREELVRRIETHPEQFVAQESVAFSTAPVRTESGITPRQVMLRVFAARDGESYRVLPGSLTRVSAGESSQFRSIQFGGGSKDTWVLYAGDEKPSAWRPPEVALAAQSSRANLPSSVAENLFWLGRYAERVETNVRLVRALLPALSGEEDFRDAVSLETAVRLLTCLGYLPPEVATSSLAAQLRSVQRLLSEVVYDRTQIFGLGWNLKEMRRVAWHLKERLSLDTWRVLQQIETDFSTSLPKDRSQRYVAQIDLLNHAIVTLSAFSGLLMENTTRGHGWRFLEIGRRLERTLQMAELLRCSVAEAPESEIESHLQVLLRIADSSITYRTRYLTVLRADLVLELLLADESNPRSLGFQLFALDHHIQKLPGHTGGPLELQSVQDSLRTVRETPLAELCRRNDDGRLEALDKLFRQISAKMYDLSDALTANYLSHVTASPLRSSS